jgi:hypothetical protein
MVERGRYPEIAVEALPEALVPSQPRGDDLEDDAAPGRRLDCAVETPGSTRLDWRLDPVPAKRSPAAEGIDHRASIGRFLPDPPLFATFLIPKCEYLRAGMG